jgi:hypothetical protein
MQNMTFNSAYSPILGKSREFFLFTTTLDIVGFSNNGSRNPYGQCLKWEGR